MYLAIIVGSMQPAVAPVASSATVEFLVTKVVPPSSVLLVSKWALLPSSEWVEPLLEDDVTREGGTFPCRSPQRSRTTQLGGPEGSLGAHCPWICHQLSP